jgi:hypothetical protein
MQVFNLVASALSGLTVKNFGPEWELGGKSFIYICVMVE